MSVLPRLVALSCALALLGASLAAGAGATSPTASAAGAGKAGKKKGKHCKKGYKPKTVINKKGKKAKVCRKDKGPISPGNDTPAPAPLPTLFEAPGTQLSGEAAKPFLQKYLLNSRFTDCPVGWPACGGFENRYSHTADSTFYKCLLRPTSGSDVKSVGEYSVDNARVEADGSWTFHEVVSWYSEYAAFEWHVAANGIVEGAVQSHPGETPEKIGPLQYVSGARDCSY